MEMKERGMTMLLSELAQKELIQVEDGIRYGLLADTDLYSMVKQETLLDLK